MRERNGGGKKPRPLVRPRNKHVKHEPPKPSLQRGRKSPQRVGNGSMAITQNRAVESIASTRTEPSAWARPRARSRPRGVASGGAAARSDDHQQRRQRRRAPERAQAPAASTRDSEREETMESRDCAASGQKGPRPHDEVHKKRTRTTAPKATLCYALLQGLRRRDPVA